MKLPGSRTRAKLIHDAKAFVFDKANFQSMVDLREKHALEDSMGFRGQFDNHRTFQIEMLKQQGLLPYHRFLELGCGPLTAAIPVIDYLDTGHYVGVDIRSSVLGMGWREIGKNNLARKNPRLICSDNFGSDFISAERAFDFVYSFSVLFHLNDELLDRYFATVSRRLSSDGKCIANINTHLDSDKWLEFPFLKRSIEDYRVIALKHGLQTSDLGTIRSHGFKGGTEGENPLLSFHHVDI